MADPSPLSPPARDRPAPPDPPEPAAPRRPPLGVVAALLIGAVLGAYGTLTWNVRPSGRVVTGVVGAIDDTAAAIRLSEPAELTDTGLGIAGVLWRDGAAGGDPADAEWQRGISEAGFPTCLTPLDVGRTVRLGLVTDPGGAGRPAAEVVAWIECGNAADGE